MVKEPEKRNLKTILKDMDLWTTTRIWMIGLLLAIIGRIVAIWDLQTSQYISLFVALCFLGGFMLAGPVRKSWDKDYKK